MLALPFVLASSIIISLGTQAFVFDCAKAFLPVDFVICSDPQVFRANEYHEAAWYTTRTRLNDVQKRELLENQRLWLKQYPPTCGIPARGRRPATIPPAAQRCVATALLARAEFLKGYGTLPDTPSGAATASKKIGSIDEVDFLNFTFPLSDDCLNKTISLRMG